jgi:hypothetical protein
MPELAETIYEFQLKRIGDVANFTPVSDLESGFI